MIILGIETSCDETSAAVLKQTIEGVQILSNIVGTSMYMQEKYGGVIPEQAAREQLKSIILVITEALEQADVTPEEIDAIAVTQGPGLIGSLLVGVETVKTLSWIWDKPIIPINHLIGHFYANWISSHPWGGSQTKLSKLPGGELQLPLFPCLGLLVSGGHSDLVLFTDHGKFEYLGGTRDDAAGECFDKCARLIGFAYPGGPKVSKIAQSGNPKAFKLPRPLSDSDDFDFSFSGLKTAFSNLVAEHFQVTKIDPDKSDVYWHHIVLDKTQLDAQEQLLADLCASLEQAIIDSLVKKVVKASQKYPTEQIIVAGGVAANPKLKEKLIKTLPNKTILIPPPQLCTDNGAMIASAAFFQKNKISFKDLQADPNLSLAY